MSPLEIQNLILNVCDFPKDIYSIIEPYIGGDILQDELKIYELDLRFKKICIDPPKFEWDKS